MAEDDVLIEQMKENGWTCGKLKSKESRERREAGEFRKMKAFKLAETQEIAANTLKSLRQKVCKLR